VAGNTDISGEQLLFNFAGEVYQKVYGTFYNPNYAGIYYAMMMPMICAALSKDDDGSPFWKHWRLQNTSKRQIGLAFLMVLTLLCVIGTGSKSAVVVIVLQIGLWGIHEQMADRQRRYNALITFTVFCVVFGIYDIASGNTLIKRLVNGFSVPKAEEALEDITVQQDCVQLQFRGKIVSFSYEEDGEALYPVFIDENGKTVSYSSDEKTQTCSLSGEDFEGLTFQCYRKNSIPYIVMEYNNIKWRFTNATEDGAYSYITIWGKPDSIQKADSLLFKGGEALFTNRGYIWSRTLPLFKNYWLLGSGPDTFLLVFPQNDYVARANLGYGFFNEILTKPHNLYLQMGVQTGMLSLVCFLYLLLRYFIQSMKMYYLEKNKQSTGIRKQVDNLGFYFFLSVFTYAVMGITNDSMLVTAPYFWLMLGMGMRYNHLQLANK
jgi:hypothetical protein